MASGPDPSTPLASQLILVLALIIINGFFVAAEISIISVNKNKIRILAEEGDKRAKTLLIMLNESNKYLGHIQTAITLAGFTAAAFAAVSLSEEFRYYLELVKVPYSKELAIVLIALLLSCVNLVLGVIYPRRLTLNHLGKIALALAVPVYYLTRLLKPMMFVVSKTVNLLLRITGQNTQRVEDEYSEDEVMSMLEVGQSSGEIKEEGKKMINAIFEFDDKLAYEIMTPRTAVFCIDINDDPKEYAEDILEMRYSRIPVYEDDMDNIIGILHIKDFILKALDTGAYNVELRPLLRKPYFVPDTKNIDSLFFDLQNTKNQIAVLIDEYGGFSGIVSMEDIIEEIVGDIDDEYDEPELGIERLEENVYFVAGSMELDTLNEEIGTKLESEESETLGGYLLEKLGEIPNEDAEGIIVEAGDCRFTIISVKERRIEKVRLERLALYIDLDKDLWHNK